MLFGYNEISGNNFYVPIEETFKLSQKLNLDLKKYGFSCYRMKDSIWKEYYLPNIDIENQGFKIHVSSNINFYQKTFI